MVNPNSYNYHLGEKIKVYKGHEKERAIFEEIVIPQEGMVLEPHMLYLASTMEHIGSDIYAMSLIGKSSLGRLGLFLQVSANLGHTGSSHRWTLELVAAKKIKIFPKMLIGQVSFWINTGKIEKNKGTFANFSTIRESI